MVRKAQTPAEILAGLVEGATAKWAKQRKAEERDAKALARREDRLVRYQRPVSQRDAAFYVMQWAYLEASANGTLPANARQIYYAARPKILEIADRNSLGSNISAKPFSSTTCGNMTLIGMLSGMTVAIS
jgi:hypothetical protein